MSWHVQLVKDSMTSKQGLASIAQAEGMAFSRSQHDKPARPHLHGTSRGDGLLQITPNKLARRQAQCWPDPLATS